MPTTMPISLLGRSGRVSYKNKGKQFYYTLKTNYFYSCVADGRDCFIIFDIHQRQTTGNENDNYSTVKGVYVSVKTNGVFSLSDRDCG